MMERADVSNDQNGLAWVITPAGAKLAPPLLDIRARWSAAVV